MVNDIIEKIIIVIIIGINMLNDLIIVGGIFFVKLICMCLFFDNLMNKLVVIKLMIILMNMFDVLV